MIDCLFCKIVKGEVSSHKVYEDDSTFVFLDVGPVSKGHLLVVPKKHFENIHDVDENVLKNIILSVKKMSSLVKYKLNASGVNIVNASGKDAQQSVFHLHFHVVPRYKDDSLDMWFHGKSEKDFDLEEIKKSLLD